jgi:Flp pilus assembly protein TadG
VTRRRNQRGAAATELVLITPLVIIMFLFVVLAGRLAVARGDVGGAARDAARAASVARSSGAAAGEAKAAAEASLARRGVTCSPLSVSTDTGSFEPGGTVTVSVRCNVKLSDLSLLMVPGSRLVQERAVEVIDQYRGADE